MLGHEISHAVERDHYNVIRKQEITTVGKDVVAGEIDVAPASRRTTRGSTSSSTARRSS